MSGFGRAAVASAAALFGAVSVGAPSFGADGSGGHGAAAGGHVRKNRDGRTAPLLDGLGAHHFAVSTKSERAQRYFDQGLVLAYAFNHAEAARSFREAARLDPDCAMAHWGVALVLGPNINAAMRPEDVAPAYEAMRRAAALAEPGKVTERERDLIGALAARYAEKPAADRTLLDAAYAKAMREVHKKHPADADVAALFAESVMDTTPWNYWLPDGGPKPETREVLAALEGALARDPVHPGANHFYIHATEASPHPEKGLAAAHRLATIAPGAGHLVHMAAHTYMRVGRYHDAVEANERAIVADDMYLAACRAQGLYPAMYVPHCHHFLWSAASMAGMSGRAIEAAKHMAAHIDAKAMREPGAETLQHFHVTPLYAYVRFGRWEEILAEPMPDLPYPRGVWHYARGMALTRTGKADAAALELAKLRTIAADPALKGAAISGLNPVPVLLGIAAEALEGETAAARGDHAAAERHLRRAVEMQDAQTYDEPPAWHYPVRQSLGAVLLEAGKVAGARVVFEEDLERNPENGWSLFGLLRCLRAQGDAAGAAGVERRFRAAWTRADVVLTSARF